MKNLIIELLRVEIDDVNHTFNGFTDSQMYYKQMSKEFSGANLDVLLNKHQAKIVLVKLSDFDDLINAVGMNEKTIEAMINDAKNNDKLWDEVEWYRTIYDCLNVKKLFYNRILDIIKETDASNNQTKGVEIENQPQRSDGFCNGKELCKIYPQLSYNNVKDRKWRDKNNFPQNPEIKGKQIYSIKKVEEWINEHFDN